MREFAVPSGMRDLVLDEAKKKKVLQLEIENRLDKWGYQEIMTPSIEFYRTYSVGFDDIREEDLYKFFDDNGRILALKADMTIPIARVVATKFKDSNETLRFRYCANVFKVHETLSGNKNEITDCGVELIGVDKKTGDLEILVTALDALQVVNSAKLTLEIGDVQFFQIACEKANLTDEQSEKLGYLIDHKSLIELDDYLNEIDLPNQFKKFFSQMVWWNGDISIFKEVEKYAFDEKLIQIINRLRVLDKQLASLGYKDIITYDLGKIGNLNYYTGLVFDAFVEGVGLRVMSGGRYDNLIKKYGIDLPAVGFSIKLDQLMNAFCYIDDSEEIVIEYGDEDLLEALKKRETFENEERIILKLNSSLQGVIVKGEVS
ncbi:ATP phosphoribosyltransferase regulatory subunit [Breznakia sp. PF5-3]|uniref:ATP phosphoribosyltransferase regulatory subunit n=1 Tax=unclassified Breznakia TaxID=2623764 RepID=UPI0024067DE9|nr:MULTISPECIES: ATP phosphoribosyltransferase regulatory subunit [unclassified Breznakia]MDF9825636.1 ATP phosphoribosyltransferase regulatory subunit [Breznakia sp. PM6-1]MDF9836474.1 ATP phosphoribosyltransferase regulatory subunit [Breznakia sp. PF5-3]MDF9838681.1 ATP phosphoribosyltransferase regulatory subunit [Breznakia sp. PFB2-8]MDF9860694.1 ATP phosphoribosyltransferase regulatory subunit [Breznakia sp. PH5-24]